MRLKLFLILFALSAVTAACAQSPSAPAPTSVPESPAAAPQAAPTLAPERTATVSAPTATAEPAATATTEPTPMALPEPTTVAEFAPAGEPFSVTDDGFYVRGLASAPIVLEDYSDFL